MERYGILGSGVVGQALAKGFAKHGHEVRIASRSPEKLANFSRETGITAVTFADAAGWAEAPVLSVKGLGAEEALRLAGKERLEAKLVIDTTNPISNEPPQNGVLRYFTGANDSLMERLQVAFPEVHFVKAFNSVGSALMVDPKYAAGKPTMFYCATMPAPERRWRVCWSCSAGRRWTWVRSRRHGPSSRLLSSGAFPGSCEISGPMHSSFSRRDGRPARQPD